MLDTRLLTTAAVAVFAAGAVAQTCPINVYPVSLVGADGTKFAEAPFYPGETIALAPKENLHVAFDPSTPSGTYYVHVVTEITGSTNDAVMSKNDSMDRFVTITNDNGVISLSLPFSTDPGSTVFGTGLNGVGQSLPLGQLGTPGAGDCTYYVQMGDTWDLSGGPESPYVVRTGLNAQTGQCATFSAQAFRIGDGTGSDVSGNVFLDVDRSGALDGTENGAAGVEVKLLGDGAQLTTTTDGNGNYVFVDVPEGEWTLEVPVPAGYVATTQSSETLEVCGCGDVNPGNVGIDLEILPSNAKPRHYWRSNVGATEAVNAGILPTLPMLGIVNTCGQFVSPGSKNSLRWYLRWANSWNMAYSLSGQLVTMQANVVTGRVHLQSVINDPQLGQMTIAQLMQDAIAAIQADTYTPPCSGGMRPTQRRLRNALWRASKNRIWQ